MDNPPSIQVNVPPLPSNRSANAMNGMSSIRPLSADRALQFTPFAHSVLPLVERIPIPEPARVRENARLSTSTERARARQSFSQQNLQTLIQNELVHLLNRKDLTQIDFKLPPTPSSDKIRSNVADLGLSQMARSVLKMSKVDYRYPTPEDDKPTVVVQVPPLPKAHRLPTPTDSSSPVVRPKVEQQQTFNGNLITKQPGLVVKVPVPPASYRPEDYETLRHSPKRRKISQDDNDFRTTTQKQQSDEALQVFQDLIYDIFEAQDLIDSSDGTSLSAKARTYFNSLNSEAEDILTLNLKTLDRLRDDLKKLSSLRRIPDVIIESQRRLQQICEPSVERGQTIYFRPSHELSFDDITSWRENMSKANNSVCSATVVLYIMIGNPQQESLLSADLLRWSSTTLVNALENCLIPVIEARPDAADSTFFQLACSCAESLKQLLHSSRRLLELMATACIEVKGGDACVNAIEFLAAKLIFVQNATTEKSSALGLQIYETFRKSAMATLAKMYARFPRERSAILDEILSSLDKLPSTSRSARTYRVADGQTIQLISALFMQLVQTTAMDVPTTKSKKRGAKILKRQNSDSEDEQLPDEDEAMEQDDDPAHEAFGMANLKRRVEQLFHPALRSAQDIVLYLIAKASKTSKTGDSPYRNILDLLVEDLINVLDNYEWPSAELLLHVLAVKMLDLAQHDKAALTKNMALESLGIMGSAISKLRAKLPQVVNSVTTNDSSAGYELARLTESYSQSGGVPPHDLVSLEGPFIMVAEFFQKTVGKNTLLQQGARGYFAAHFASLVTQTADKISTNASLDSVVEYLINMLSANASQGINLDRSISRDLAHAAYLVCILHLRFCRRLPDIVKVLSLSVSSDQAQVRSRSLKSVSAILEIDSSLLDRDPTIADEFFKCTSDGSAMVRDSALSLIARFIVPRGGLLEKRGIERLLQCASDEKVAVQKRSIGALKEFYASDQRAKLKTMIAQTLFQRLNDHEESIVSLSEQTLEDILVKPAALHVNSDENGAAANVAVEDLTTTLMTLVADEPQHYIPLLKIFLASMLRREGKLNNGYQSLCVKLVQSLFEKIIATEKTRPPLLVITALAEANPKLIPPLQLSKLQVYLSDIQKESDLFMFRSAVGIFRLVLPNLSETHKTLMKDIQDLLMKSINKLGRRLELDAVMQCLSTIDGVLCNTERLVKLSGSVLNQLPSPNVSQQALVKLLQIAGAMGKYIDLDKFQKLFEAIVPKSKGMLASAYAVHTILPLTTSQSVDKVRTVALESLGSVCQAFPAHFNKPLVRSTFFNILKLTPDESHPENHNLKAIVLNIFDELFAAKVTTKEKADKSSGGQEQALKQMGGDERSRDQDSAISAITMDVVDAVLRISLSETSDNALPAAKTLASISQQGLIHPKQCLGAFVAFGTSENLKIAAIGHHAQHLLHEQHESHCEREYMSAIVRAFEYQQTTEHDARGAVSAGQAGYRAKLGRCFEIVVTSNSKYVKKFLSGLVSRTLYDSSTSEKSLPTIDHVMFTRFVMQNVAFFDYQKFDELLHVILQLELAYSKTGEEIASRIETAQREYPDIVSHHQILGDSEIGLAPVVTESKDTDPALRLEYKRLSTAAACLMLLIETRSHLLRQYVIGRDVRAAMMNSKQTKDTNKTPNKRHGITGEQFWSKSNEIFMNLETSNGSEQLCKDFVMAMSMDDDFETTEDHAFNSEAMPLDNDSSLALRTSTPGGRKRKLSITPGATPTKRARGRPKKSQGRRSSSISTNEDADADFEV